ncbi:GDSL esterase/lipase At1g29660-like [Punica granatum]|uniref:GDSL esterase/lipase At1g29660-like n=1 Tax=Punica granatum TaxID=22663 RepID=A0A6P8C2B0_PUNGR|nr:GDSL esterase/lipase At1g29660-like [Punica granatum]
MGFDSMRRILLAFLFFTQCLHDFVQGAPQVPCYFIFGDSLADCGNNNNLNTLARPNYYPYGLDFPKGPTGRFTNGRTVADVIGLLCSNYVLYNMTCSNNDYMNNYFMPEFYPTSKEYTPQQYADVLVKQYSEQLKRLYSYGARKVAIFGVGLIGQVPEMKNRFGANSSMVDDAAQLFSNKLLPLVNDLNRQLTCAKFTYIDTTAITITSAPLLAFLHPRDTCCELVKNLGICIEGRPPCPLRGLYAYFDGFHPTEVVNKAFATRAYDRLLPSDASPYGIKQLAQLP